MTLKTVRRFTSVPTERGLICKINRMLPEYYKLHKSRPHHKRDLGTYYVVDHYHNAVFHARIEDLADLCVELRLYPEARYPETGPQPG
jgi:hypothetical protein